jgi:hypothetical protein
MVDLEDTRGAKRFSSSCCTICGGRRQLVRITPKAGPMPELRTFECIDCSEVSTVEIVAIGAA